MNPYAHSTIASQCWRILPLRACTTRKRFSWMMDAFSFLAQIPKINAFRKSTGSRSSFHHTLWVTLCNRWSRLLLANQTGLTAGLTHSALTRQWPRCRCLVLAEARMETAWDRGQSSQRSRAREPAVRSQRHQTRILVRRAGSSCLLSMPRVCRARRCG